MNPPKRNTLLNIQFVMNMNNFDKTSNVSIALQELHPCSTEAEYVALSFKVCESVCKGLVTPDKISTCFPIYEGTQALLTQYHQKLIDLGTALY